MVKKKKKKRKNRPKGWADHLLTSELTLIEDITADKQMQQRVSEDKEALEEYKSILADGGELPAIKCVRDENDTLWLWDGFHTLEAAKRAGLNEIRVEISEGTRRDAWLKSLGANAKHGIRRSRADRQKAIDSALNDPEIKLSLLNEEDRKHSFRSVAKLCAVDHKTVSTRWKGIHLLRIESETDEKLGDGPPFGSTISEEAWLSDVASDLGLPLSWVKKRWKLVQEQASRSASEEPPLGGEFPTGMPARLTNSTGSQEDLKSGEFPTNSAAQDEVSQEDLTSGEFPTGMPARLTNSAGSQEDLKSGEFPTNSAAQDEVSQEDLTGGEFPTDRAPLAEIIRTPQPVPTVVVLSPNVTIHNPTRHQLYDGGQSSNILVNYATQQHGVRVVAARRPSDGWTKETSQEISQALAQVTNQGIENVKSVLIMIVKD